MPIDDAATSLRLATDLPGWDDINWTLEELYQREVDWMRVERKIVPYLRSTAQPQFFNALTIALLPLESNISTVTTCFDRAMKWQPPELKEPGRFGKTLTVGPVACGYWEDWADFSAAEAKTGQMRWNPEQVFAVALDGQHRLAAIKKFVEKPGTADRQTKDTAVPVIFVVLDPEFGYVAPRRKPVVEVLRTVFIDLNKNAKIPSRARQILLDDKDSTSVCVRALIGKALCDDIGELRAAPPRVPLSLVDWHTEQAKFDDGPYVTTILVIDWIIAELTGAKPIQDFMDYSAIRRQLVALKKSLYLDMDAAYERLAEIEKIEMRPFGFLEDELGMISRAFQAVWNPVFVELLTEFSPYQRIIELRGRRNAFTRDFSNWYRLRWHHKKDKYAGRATEEYNRFLGRLSTREKPLGQTQLDGILADIEGIKHRNLAVNVVFQRAYFLAFAQLRSVKDTDLGELVPDDIDFDELEDGEDDNVSLEESTVSVGAGAGGSGDSRDEGARHLLNRAKKFVQAMNTLLEAIPEILDPECTFAAADGEERRFWLGTFLTADQGIDFTLGASRRGQEVIFWVVAMQMYDELVEPEADSAFDNFWKVLKESSGGLTNRVWRSVRRFSDKDTSAGGRILAARGEEFTPERSREEVRCRMAWLWQELGL